MDSQHKHTSSPAAARPNNRGNAVCDGSRRHDVSQPRVMIKPTITELTKEVRTNILCTVEGCGKILPNTPALNMHLVKSHRIKVKRRTCSSRGLALGASGVHMVTSKGHQRESFGRWTATVDSKGPDL